MTGVLTMTGGTYRWQEETLEGRERGKTGSDSLGHKHTDQEVKT